MCGSNSAQVGRPADSSASYGINSPVCVRQLHGDAVSGSGFYHGLIAMWYLYAREQSRVTPR